MSELTLNTHHQEDMSLEELRPHGRGNGHLDPFKGWYEVKMTGKLPERRSYQVSEVYNEYLYIFGGQDLKEGAYNNLWRLPLKHIMDGGTTSWEQVTNMTGKIPKPISHHSGFIYTDSLYVYGGLVESDSNPHLYALNLNTMVWTIVDQSQWSQVPPARDDHSACISADNQMYIFGGYVKGGKSNDLWKYDLENNDWEELDKGDYFITDPKYHQNNPRDKPAPRIGSSIIEYKNVIYLLGGHDESNEKLDDFWKFDLATKKWQLIESAGSKPTGRNGHTMVLINNKIVTFGGILEITKESDDVFIYDFAKNQWSTFESAHLYGNSSPINVRDTDSQHDDKQSALGKSNTKKLKKTSSMPHLNASQNNEINLRSSQKFSTNNNHSIIGSQIETSTVQKDGRRNSQGSSLTRKPTINATDQQFIKYMRGQEALSSPTSIQMKNAFILKNSNQSFEQYFLAMKKRRNVRNGLSINLSMSLDGGNSKSAHIQKNKPSARDGHSSFVFHDKMFIFGGDRHHMPFNDLFFLDIDI